MIARRIASVLCLVICLNVLVELASDPPSRAVPVLQGTGFPAEENPKAVTGDAVSVITPSREPALFPHSVDVARFFNYPLLITKDPAAVQCLASCLAHGDWQRFARVPAAPFSGSRSLPLEI